jgi:hypothetical protein
MHLKKFLILAVTILVFFPNLLFAEKFDHRHQELDKILNIYVKNGNVRYKALSKDRKPLSSYLKNLSSVSSSEFKSFTEAEQIAFLINAYNAFTLELILNHYPVKSIKNIGGNSLTNYVGMGNPWKIYNFDLLGEKRNLDWIEHSKLRVDYKEPRIHFAINCASIGCPALRNASYTGKNLEKELEEVTQSFLADRSKNSWDPERNTIVLSKIFKWFAVDFEKKSGSVVGFVQPYFKGKFPNNVKIEYSDYDWSLNESR